MGSPPCCAASLLNTLWPANDCPTRAPTKSNPKKTESPFSKRKRLIPTLPHECEQDDATNEAEARFPPHPAPKRESRGCPPPGGWDGLTHPVGWNRPSKQFEEVEDVPAEGKDHGC